MIGARYVVRPKADQDLTDQARYYALQADPQLGHRFLASAHNTFALLATQPQMGWTHPINRPELKGLRLFRVTGFEKIMIFYRQLDHGVDILRVVHGSQNLQRLFRRHRI